MPACRGQQGRRCGARRGVTGAALRLPLTLQALQGAVDGAGAAAARHGDVELVGVFGHGGRREGLCGVVVVVVVVVVDVVDVVAVGIRPRRSEASRGGAPSFIGTLACDVRRATCWMRQGRLLSFLVRRREGAKGGGGQAEHKTGKNGRGVPAWLDTRAGFRLCAQGVGGRGQALCWPVPAASQAGRRLGRYGRSAGTGGTWVQATHYRHGVA